MLAHDVYIIRNYVKFMNEWKNIIKIMKGGNIMKKNFLKRFLSISLASFLAVGMMTGCGEGTTEISSSAQGSKESTSVKESSEVASSSVEVTTDPEVGVTYPLDTDVTLKIATWTDAAVTASYESRQETPFIEELQKRTGVKVELVELGTDAFKLLLSGGDIGEYDIIWNNLNFLPASSDICIEDEVIIPLDEYLDDCMPDYKALLESSPLFEKGAKTADGQVYRAAMFKESQYMMVTNGAIIRWDWLKELNMEIPETPDELYEVLVAFRDKMGAEVPLSIPGGQMYNFLHFSGITNGFGLPTIDFYVKDGKVHSGLSEPEMKDVFAFLHKLYDENLFDTEFATVDGATAKANLMNGRSGMWYGAVGGGIGTIQTQMAETNPNFELTGVPGLVENKGDAVIKPSYTSFASTFGACILPSCKNPEIAAKFLNYGYTEEGINFWNFGIEGISYNMVDGYPTYTELIMNNPDGLTIQQAMAKYCLGYSGLISIQQDEYLEQYSTLPGQKKALENWCKVSDEITFMPSVEYSDDIYTEFSRIESEIWTYYDQMMVGYINGTKSLDNFESEYMATLKSLNIDRYIELAQAAYDEYMAE